MLSWVGRSCYWTGDSYLACLPSKCADCLNLKRFWVKKIFFGLFSVKSDCSRLINLLKEGLRKSSGHHVTKISWLQHTWVWIEMDVRNNLMRGIYISFAERWNKGIVASRNWTIGLNIFNGLLIVCSFKTRYQSYETLDQLEKKYVFLESHLLYIGKARFTAWLLWRWF